MNNDYGETTDIAEATLFLASEKSKYINASDLIVDGGFLTKGI
jgi:NAD(P)-dependent dehydrogenase (short-subunit alcohol dehydrogenase family)